MSYGEILFNLAPNTKTLLRKKENIMKKIINCESAITFNEICIRENLLPIYTSNINRDGVVNQLGRRHRKPSAEERKDYMRIRIRDLKRKLHELSTTQILNHYPDLAK